MKSQQTMALVFSASSANTRPKQQIQTSVDKEGNSAQHTRLEIGDNPSRNFLHGI